MPSGEIAAHPALEVGGSREKMRDGFSQSTSSLKLALCDKINFYGIEVVNRLMWKIWEPGREYIKTLVLKNLGIKTLKLKYKIPESRFFSTLYPKPIFLSAGASFALPVTFRPLENIEYMDRIIFTLKDGSEFEIPLMATLPQMDISLPINLDFKMCAVKDSIFIMFDVFNIGDVDTALRWEVSEPFSVEPVEAELKHRGSMKFRAAFKPTAAFVYEVTAICRFGKDLEFAGQTTFFGVGKFPHLLVSCPGMSPQTNNLDTMAAPETEVNFGKVAVAFTAAMYVELHNLSAVQTPFHVERVPGMNRIETVFRCTETQGIVPPFSLVKIPLTFSPVTVNMTSIDYFLVMSVSDISHSIIKCIGTAKGPNVELSTYSINFKQIDVGCSCVKALDVINNSDVEAVYQFELDCEESVFKFPDTSGVVAPRSKQTVLLQFLPQHPIIYYRRVVFLVHNQLPLYIDLLGTCHSDAVKPAILRHHHLAHYLTHVERGLSLIPPENLNELLKAGRLKLDQNGCLFAIFPEDKISLTPNPNPRDIRSEDEYFGDGFHTDCIHILQHVSLDVNVLDFGNVHNIKVAEQKTVNITNHTRGKVMAQWMGDASHVFSVSPDNLDIPPLKSCSFRVTFRPNAPNKIYGNELECFVFYKSMRDYQLVSDMSMCPPWCLTVRCLGHTFMPNNDTFLPRLTVEPRVVVFPAVNVGESACQSVLLRNTGDTPILYELRPGVSSAGQARLRCTVSEENNVFLIKPRKGLLRSGYQVITVRMTPTAINRFSSDLLLRLNDLEKYDQMIHLCGSAECAEIVLDSEGNMYFKPTCAGTSSSRTYSFKNISRTALRFQWKLNKEDEKYLTVEPSSGVVQANESVSQTWTFTPTEERKYVLKASLVAWAHGLTAVSSESKKQYFSLRVIGEGSYGDLQSDQKFLHFGDILVGSSATCPINIYNNSNCSLHFRLIIDSLDKEDGQEKFTNTAERTAGVEFDSMEGDVPARGKCSITATIKPMRRMLYQFAVSYQLVIPNNKVMNSAVLEPQHLVHLLATGVYPSITVRDIRSQGSAVGISKKSLWKLFSLSELNTYLNSDPGAGEALQGSSTQSNSFCHHKCSTSKTVLDFNFSAAPVGSEPCIITIMFQNNRTVLCEWAFLLPKDVQMEMAHWTESGDNREDELHEMKAMDNKLFDVTPRKGTLQPGESVTVTMTYLHSVSGTDHLPVIFKIARGREIMLNFIGATVERDCHYIHFASNKHSFTPVPIGEKISPKQVYDLYNGGAVPVSFEVNLMPLDIINKENYDQHIFECLTPSGMILPGQTLAMEWRFSPLEAKTYMVDIPIKVHDGDTSIISFSGIGFDQRLMGDTMPLSDEEATSGVPSVQTADLPGQEANFLSDAFTRWWLVKQPLDMEYFINRIRPKQGATLSVSLFRWQLGYLSMDRMSFGNVPVFSQARRMIFVTNRSSDRSIFFEWHVKSLNDSQLLNVYPAQGKIGPGEYRMCRVTFIAADTPAFCDLDLVCEISDLLEYTNYRQELAAWEAEYEKQLNEFTVTESDPSADMRTPDVINLVGGPLSGRLSLMEELAERHMDPRRFNLHKYKALPSIGHQLTVFDQLEMNRRRMKKLSQLWQKPLPQKPFMLHLGVTARTHDHHQFQTNFADEFDHYYIDRILSEHSQQQKKQENVPQQPVVCSLAESDIIAGVLGNCLRGLLDDAHFIQAVKKVMQEPIPYFRQFADLQPDVPDSGNVTVAAEVHDTPKLDEEAGSITDEGESQTAFSIAASDVVGNLQEETPSFVVAHDREMSFSGQDIMSMQASFRMSLHPDERSKQEMEAQVQRATQAIKKLPEFGNIAEKILENSLLNLMYEALTSDFSVVRKPRFIAMASKRFSGSATEIP